MKSQQAHIYNSRFFTLIAFALFLLGSSQTVFSQTTVTLTTVDNGNTVTIPANATNVIVEVWGAGGSGAGGGKSGPSNVGGGGGGGGEYSRSINISPGNYSFQVGAGAPAGLTKADGSQGLSSSFDGGTVLANGGGGGIYGGAGGAGGTGGAGNDANVAGTNGSPVAGTTGGDGGAGANGGAGGAGSSQGAGTDGSIPGGGGGGGSGNGQIGGAGADGRIVITYTTGAVAPTITLTNPNPSVVQGTTSANITYSATTGTPTTYSITYDATALGQGFLDVSGIDLTDPIIADVPSGAAINVYNGTLTVNNGVESIGYPITIEVTAPVVPTITLGTSPSVAQGITSVNLPYTATSGSPTTYSVTYDAAALGAGFSNVTDATLFASPIVLTVPPTAPITTYNGTLTVSNGQVSTGYSFTITVTAPVPTITLTVANPSVVQGTTSANITYSATTGTPTTYSINYNAAAESAGFLDVTGIALGSPIIAVVPSGAPIAIYNGTLTVNNGQESSGYAITITVTAPPPPTLTLGSFPSVLQGTTSANLSYSATGNPTTYSITYDATAISAGFATITNAPLSASPILLTVPAAAPFAVYNATLTVSNGQVSPNYLFTITIKEIQGHSLTNCSACHITHSSPGTTLTSVAGNALLCQSCHISTGVASAKPLLNVNKATPGISGNSHAWDVPAANSNYQTLAPAAGTEMGMRLAGDNIICSTCHNQHNNGNAGDPYLRVDNTGDAMCKDCHSVRDVQLFQNGPTNKGSHPVGIPYNAVSKLKEGPTSTQLVGGNVECSSCHGVHDVTNSTLTTDGNLLRMPNGNSLCMDCHNYPTHHGFDCLDCHEVHNTVDGTIGNNIFMIKDKIDIDVTAAINLKPVVFTAESGANSFVDKDLTNYDGVCEVCHTGTIKHTSTGGETLHIDGTDKREQSCVGCHFHNVGFETPSGPLTCVGCHSSAQPGGRGGVVQIVGATIGEMNNTLSSRHTASGIGFDPLNEECEACHFDNGTSHPTSIMMLRNPDAAAVFIGSDTDVYCVQCHDGDAPITPVDFSYISNALYNKASYIATPHDTGDNSCLACHETHGSQNAALTMQATNYENCFACHNGVVAGTTISAADIAIPGTSGTGHAFNVPANSGLYETNTPSDAAMAARLDASGNIICSTCHDPHANTFGKLLVSNNSGDEMCKDCHLPRDKGTYAADPINNIGSHPVGIAYPGTANYKAGHTLPLVGGNVECSSCHGVHNTATNDGNLLKMTNDNNLCKDCHNYVPHQGFDCLDCHQAHDGTNIMLIKDVINGKNVVMDTQTGLKSFGDGDGVYDGVCEVCHTTTLYHKNTDDGDNHNDGTNCTGCHSHNGLPPPGDPQIITSFPQGSCHSCHESTGPGDPNVYPMTGAHDKHSGELYGYKCSECHFEYGDGGALEGTHSNSSVDVNFDPTGLASRGGEDITLGYGTPTWDPATKTCSNIYCHSTGQSADRGTDGTTPWGAILGPQTPTYASPVWTETITTCDACHGGKGNMTAPYTITTTPLSPDAHLILDYGTDAPLSGLHTNTGMFNDSDSGAPGPTGDGRNATVQCYLCHNTNGAANDGTNYQGTYGAPEKLHVDGQTYFKHALQTNGGTWAPWGTYMDHCISKGNWN